MNYESLLKLVKEKNNISGEKCLICHFPINNIKDNIKLNCGHHYHLDCVNLIRKTYYQCLYCEKKCRSKTCKVKECKNKTFTCDKLCSLHKDYIKSKKTKKLKKQIIDVNICQTILKSGKKKGNVCGRKKCGYHNKTIII
jgi:hypothetical protein